MNRGYPRRRPRSGPGGTMSDDAEVAEAERGRSERPQPAGAQQDRAGPPSFSKPLFTGEINEELIFPYHELGSSERDRVAQLSDEFRTWAEESYDSRTAEAERWIGDDTVAELGEMGLLGLYVPEEYGGLGLSQTGYCRVFEEVGQVDATLATVLGVHQSIGYKGIALFGSDEQKERYLPDLATGRKLAGFALTEPEAGSDAYHLDTWAEQESDGSWRLNGEKRYIGNGSKGDVFVTFARSDHGHVALIVEKDMEGFEVGRRYDTLGLHANDLRHLHFNGVRVPAENVLGEPGDGFEIAMNVLNNGRISLGTGTVGGTKDLLDRTIDRVKARRQFGQALAEFELVEEKIAWMVTYLFGLESMAYATTGLVDRGVPDYSLESAMLKIAGSEFIWYAANRSFQLAGGDGFIKDHPYEKILRDIRIFPIFEGANDVLRAFVALHGFQTLGETLPDVRGLKLRAPIQAIGTVFDIADYLIDRVERGVRPDRITAAHPDLQELAEPVTDQVKHLRAVCERLLRRHGEDIKFRQWQQKRVAHAALDIYAQVCTLARVTRIFEDRGGREAAGHEHYIARTFCERAAHRVHRSLERVEDNDDERMHAIARISYERGAYGYNLFSI
jgi:acyl-CoA dehydrogenase family member 9